MQQQSSPIGAIVLVVIVFLGLRACSGGGSGGDITYSVDGTGSALVTYQTSSGQSQRTVDLPWSDTETGVSTASLVAQLQGAGTDISCSISGDVSASNSSSGQYAVVTCAG
jgi:hypothetical protein